MSKIVDVDTFMKTLQAGLQDQKQISEQAMAQAIGQAIQDSGQSRTSTMRTSGEDKDPDIGGDEANELKAYNDSELWTFNKKGHARAEHTHQTHDERVTAAEKAASQHLKATSDRNKEFLDHLMNTNAAISQGWQNLYAAFLGGRIMGSDRDLPLSDGDKKKDE